MNQKTEPTDPTDKSLDQTAGVMHKIGIGCVVVIGAPFLITGLIMLNVGLSDSGGDGPLKGFFLSLIGAVLVLGFCALFYKQLKSRNSIKLGLSIKQQHPKAPWKWRENWAKGEIWDNSRQRAFKAWIPVVFMAIFALAIPFIMPQINLGMYPSWITSLVAVSAIGTLVWTIRRALTETARVKKFGQSRLLMAEIPAFLGGRMSGTVETTLAEIPPDGVSVRFESVTLSSAAYKNVKVHCSTEVRIPAGELSRGTQGIIVPIDLPISTEGRPYRDQSGVGRENRDIRRDRWRLIVSASLPGIDYRAEFHPPVWELGEDGLVTDDFTDIAI